MWVLVRHEDGMMVSRPGSTRSYTRNIEHAKIYNTKDEAKADACGNETPRQVRM